MSDFPEIVSIIQECDIRIFEEGCTNTIDIIAENSSLPDLAIGEWVYVENFGAYTIAAASTFNGFQQTRCVYCFVWYFSSIFFL